MNHTTQHRVQHVFESVLGYPFTTNNHINVLRNGDEIFPAMLEAIENAQSRIEFLTFVYWSGKIAERFANSLSERARAGVNVRVLLDAFGAKEMSQSLLDMMREAGINVQWFRPKSSWKVWEIDNRTHRKVLIVDGLVGFTGGVGIASEWEGNARNKDEWRDTHFRFIGPAVLGLQGAFYGNWAETGQRIFNPLDKMPEPQRLGNALVQIIRATASTGWSDIATLLALVIAVSKCQLRIQTAYFVPDEDTIKNFCKAVQRGVEIDIIIPGDYTDERVSQLAGEAQFRKLLDGGVRLWKYQQSMLHAKIITIDGEAACLGSANFNQRSMRKDDEIGVVILDTEVVATLNRHFEDDLEQCEQLDAEQWKNRGYLQRLKEAVATPFRSHT